MGTYWHLSRHDKWREDEATRLRCIDDRCSATQVRCCARLEARSFRPVTYELRVGHPGAGGARRSVIAISQGLDTDQANPTSRLLLHILAAVAEFERELIRERVRAGVANAKKNGKQLGRPKVVFDRQRAIEMRAAGLSLPQIAGALGVGQGTVVRVLDGLSKNLPADSAL